MPAYVAFGANLGDPAATYRAARDRLCQFDAIESVRASPLYRTLPVGGPARQSDYYNGVFEVRTSWQPMELYQNLVQVQREFGRPEGSHWQPRVLDLDVILFDSQIVESADLVVPHPRAHHRWFVMQPLTDLAPRAHHPVLNRTAAELLKFLQSVDPTIYVVGGSELDFDAIREMITDRWRGMVDPIAPPVASSWACPRFQDPKSKLQNSAPSDGFNPSVLRCPVPDRDVHFYRLAGSIVGAATRSGASGDTTPKAAESIWIVVLEAPSRQGDAGLTQSWPAVDVRAESIEQSQRLLEYFLQSRRPGRLAVNETGMK